MSIINKALKLLLVSIMMVSIIISPVKAEEDNTNNEKPIDTQSVQESLPEEETEVLPEQEVTLEEEQTVTETTEETTVQETLAEEEVIEIQEDSNILQPEQVQAIDVETTEITNEDLLDSKHLVWETDENNKNYWYENNTKQGVYGQAGNVWYDGTERGREIYDPVSNGWYWLDCLYSGAKAVDKEVFMPYVYSGEYSFDDNAKRSLSYESDWYTETGTVAEMSNQVYNAMISGTGKWVRYDSSGKMYKGWYQVQGRDSLIYPNQSGNIYYYDYKTGLMAKGWTTIDGKSYHFDEVTGVLDEGTGNLTPYVEPVTVDQFETATYKYQSSYSTEYLVSVKNNSNSPAEVTVNARGYNSGGKLVGAKSDTIEVIGPGEESVANLFFSENIDHIEYDLEVDTNIYYYQVINGLSIKSSQTNNKVILTISNSNPYNAEFVKAHVVFYDKNGTIVNINSAYFTDKDFEIKPGKSVTEEISCYREFSTFKVFLDGRSNFVY